MTVAEGPLLSTDIYCMCKGSSHPIWITSAGPNILEGLIELDDVGVVHHFHDGNLLTSWSPVQQQTHQLTTTSNLTLLPKNIQQYRNILLEALDVLHLCFGNGLHRTDGLGEGISSVTTAAIEKSPGFFAFFELPSSKCWSLWKRNHTILHPASSCPHEWKVEASIQRRKCLDVFMWLKFAEASDKLIVICYLSSVLDDKLCIPDATILIHFLTITKLRFINYGWKSWSTLCNLLACIIFFGIIFDLPWCLSWWYSNLAFGVELCSLPRQVYLHSGPTVVGDCRTLRDEP